LVTVLERIFGNVGYRYVIWWQKYVMPLNTIVPVNNCRYFTEVWVWWCGQVDWVASPTIGSPWVKSHCS